MEIFGRSRWQLTLTYSIIMGIFLIVLILIMHKTIEWSMFSEQAQEILDAADSISENKERYNNAESNTDDNRLYKNTNDRLFYYVFDEDKRLIDFARASFRVESFILDTIDTWSVNEGEISVFNRPNELGRTTNIMMTSKHFRISGVNHTLYVGKDVTVMYSGLQKSTYALIFLGLLALITATIIGHVMAGKAIIPLKIAYEKQRQFAADASHELRTPLAVVMASADLLLTDQSITNPFLKQVISDVKSEVKKMSKLVSDLLIIARSDNNALKVSIKKFDLGSLLNQNIRMMTPLAEKKNITLTGENITKIEVHADEQKIKQLILILVDNAIKYTPEGGTVTVSLDNISKDKITFSVQDSGIGIAPEDQDKIFERFYRVDKVRSREIGGNGLGLSIASEIVRLHDSSISVESELGVGTKFIVELKTNTVDKKPSTEEKSDN
ncbi:MAG: sensor histidine kinase [Selenomonadaceae bacterium]|nr:sensor histidine kinase [Selenomonadaceae bacterium]MBR1858334.1 sensor histidine kinase [Selenomonadaceae bacterium]